MIELGKVGVNSIFLDLKNSVNGSMLISGKSGTGKTYKLNEMIPALVDEGAVVIILDYSGSFSLHEWNDRMKMARINTRIFEARSNEMPINPLEPILRGDGKMEEGIDVAIRFSEMVTKIYRLGTSQKSQLYEAILKLYSLNGARPNMKNLRAYLTQNQDNSAVSSLLGKMAPIFDYQLFSDRSTAFNESDRILLFQLQGFDRNFQRLVSEVLLSFFWRWATARKEQEMTVYFVLDECQNLQIGADSTFASILTEGRKFKINVIAATQFLKTQFDRAALSRLLQCGTKLFFCPAEDEIDFLAKYLDGNNKFIWKKILAELKQGECIAKGNLCGRNGIISANAVRLETLPPLDLPKRKTSAEKLEGKE